MAAPVSKCGYVSNGKEIGKGSFGRVVLAESTNRPPSPVAIKFSFPKDPGSVKSLRYEAFNLDAINGRVPHSIQRREYGNVQGLEAIILERACSSNNPQDVLNIDKMLHKKGVNAFSWQQMICCMKQLFECISALKECERTHGDIKSSNLVFNFDSYQLFVVDWGASKQYGRFKNPQYGTTETSLAPELILERGFYDWGIDVWAAGVILFQIYTGGKLPFPYHERKSSMKFVLGTLGKPSESYLNNCKHKVAVKYFTDQRYKNDWKAAIVAAANERKDTKAQAEQIIQFLERIFCYEDRISPEQALELPLFKPDVKIQLKCDEIPENERKLLFLSTLGLQIPLSTRCVHLPLSENYEYEFEIGTDKKCLQVFRATLYPGSTLSLTKDKEAFKVSVDEGLFKLNEQLKKLQLTTQEGKTEN